MAVNEELRRVGSDKSKGRMATLRSQGSQYLLSGGLLVCKRCGANMVGYRNRGRLYYICGAQKYRRGLGCGVALQVRKDEIEAAVVQEVERLFESWTDTKRLMEAMNEELRAQRQEQSSEAVEISRELTKTEGEIANLREAIKGGFDDLEWANKELSRLRAAREALISRQEALDTEPGVPEVDLRQVEDLRRSFAEALADGTNKEKRAFAQLFVKRIDVDPDTSDVWMHLFSRPPSLATKRTPASVETGVRIGLVAGAGFVAGKKTRVMRWICELPFEVLGRALDALWEEAKLRLIRVRSGRQPR